MIWLAGAALVRRGYGPMCFAGCSDERAVRRPAASIPFNPPMRSRHAQREDHGSRETRRLRGHASISVVLFDNAKPTTT